MTLKETIIVNEREPARNWAEVRTDRKERVKILSVEGMHNYKLKMRKSELSARPNGHSMAFIVGALLVVENDVLCVGICRTWRTRELARCLPIFFVGTSIKLVE